MYKTFSETMYTLNFSKRGSYIEHKVREISIRENIIRLE